MPFIPHTDDDIQTMLQQIGASDVDALFDEIPASLKTENINNIPAGLTEREMLQEAQRLAQKNADLTCFMGAGCYDHYIPAAVWDIASRGEFLTAYTPYQAEASQGTLAVLYAFQTMIAELTGMDAANASLYDGASALAEAVLMAMRLKKNVTHHRILIPETLHPLYRDTIRTITAYQDIEYIYIPFHKTKGITSLEALAAYTDATAMIIAQPNFFGCLEDVDALTNWAHQHGVFSIACVNPISLGLLTPPGAWGEHGVDIACGEGQPLGCPMASGGPFFGFFGTKMEHIRQMPGRLIGKTTDSQGKPGYTLTLQAREQHIRRAKATSNICTNQGLLTTAATIYMSLMGPQGLEQTALACHENTRLLEKALTAIPNVRRVFEAPSFHEIAIECPKPIHTFIDKLYQQGFGAGYPLESDYPTLTNTLLLCATEMRTEDEIALFAKALQDALR